MEKYRLTEQNFVVGIDLNHQIISALQINPRISWSRLGGILSADPTTLSRRWERLLDEGLVWTTCYESASRSAPNPVKVAGVEIECIPGGRDDLIASLNAEPLCYNVQCTSGDRDVLATISSSSLIALDDIVQDRIVSQPGISRTRVHYLHTIHRQGPDWRLRGITGAQARAIGQTLPPMNPLAAPKRIHRDLIEALNPDLRAPVAELSRRVGCSTPTVSRAVELILGADWVNFRIDLAHEHMGWEAEVIMWIRVDSGGLPRLVDRLNHMEETRLCASTSGKANLAVTMWLHSLGDLARTEENLRAVDPSLQVVDRWIVPRVAKRLGHVLDRQGLHDRYVPIGVPGILSHL